MKDFLSALEIKQLRQAHRNSRFRKSADRIKTILALNEGLNYPEAAKLLLLDETTIRRYEKEYGEHGVSGLLEDRCLGSAGHLGEMELRSLENHLWEHTYHTVTAICRYVRETFGKDYL